MAVYPVGQPTEPATNSSRFAPRRWTRAEWVLLSAVILFLLSTVWPLVSAAQMRRRTAMAKHDIASLRRAILRYHREYGSWPAASDARNVDCRFGGRTPNAELIRVLRAEAGSGNPDHEFNPQRMIFIEIEPHASGVSGINSKGEFIDPWGMPYQIALDTSYDNVVEIPNSIYGRVPGEGVLVWSLGPDRKPETRDDLLSWLAPEVEN